MTTFTESSTGLGLVLPEAAHTSWEGIAWQNQHLSGWVAAAQSRSTRLLTGTLANDQLTGLEVNWVLEDGTVLRRKCADHTLTYAPSERKVLYLDFDQMDATEPSKQAVLEMPLPLFADFHPSEKLFPLVHFGQYQETSTAATDFALWLAPKDLQGISAQVMPVGTVLMYDGGSWVDDVTMKGWYACIGGSVPNDGRPGAGTAIPDLRDRFVKGKNDSETCGTLGGSNDLLDHSHNVPGHYHGLGNLGLSDPGHSHGSSNNVGSRNLTSDANHTLNMYTPNTGGVAIYRMPGGIVVSIHSACTGMSLTGSHVGNSVGNNGDGVYSSYGVNESQSGANRPAFYSMIYIKRIT